MSAVFRAARGGLGGRRLQAIIIGLVVLVATAASTLVGSPGTELEFAL